MFSLAVIKDRVRIPPNNFRQTTDRALSEQINTKYANRVIPKVGLCICLFDIIERSEGYIYHSDGCSYINVTVRLVIFRPFEGEVLVGRIRSCSPLGVHVTLGFFDDILIPPELLQEGTEFDVNEQLWVWRWEGNEMYMDLDEEIRFRVVAESFTDTNPTSAQRRYRPPIAPSAVPNIDEGGIDAQTNSSKIPPYSVTAMIQGSGLGLQSWWQS
ncbi:DNA-directed RNA polymerase III subunit RPC8 [Syncephalis fuscata]|nr:DNA-directed RNA polymerase III subunit RPC8 [Syncephalis fuscata]